MSYAEVIPVNLTDIRLLPRLSASTIVDNPDTAKTVLNNAKLTYAEEEIIQNQNPTSPRRNSEAGIPSGESEYQYQLRLLRFGAIYECGFGLLRRRGCRQSRLSSRAVRSSRREALEAADLFLQLHSRPPRET
jgi:hypothetical protein